MKTAPRHRDANETSTQDRAAVRMVGATRTFGEGAAAVHALDAIDLGIERGSFVVLLGPSGSGKTTLLNAIGGIDHLDAGSVVVGGCDITDLGGRQLTEFRRDHVAFVFQLYNLIPTLTALENVEVIAELTHGGRLDAAGALRAVGIGDYSDRFPAELSGGQQQRVAVARAIAKGSPLLLCDEPTGALDRAAGNQILDLLGELNEREGHTIVIVTHDESIAGRASRVIRMLDGRIDADTAPPAR